MINARIWDSAKKFHLREMRHANILKKNVHMSGSDCLAPIGYLSDNVNLISFERAMFEKYSLKYKMKVFLFLCQYHHFQKHA